MKIFLSHSSSDKDIVGPIYEELGSAICHYDVATFDQNGLLSEEIHTALNESDTFVLFASDAALKSKWVQGELKLAFLNWMRSGLKTVMVFLLRGGERASIPEWLQAYVIVEHPTKTHISLRIKSRALLNNADAVRTPPFFRYEELTLLEQNVVMSTEHMPKAIMLSAPDGYGKKQLLNELYTRHFSQIPKFKLLISFEDCSSDVDLFRALLGLSSLLSIHTLSEKLRQFEMASEDVRHDLLVSEIIKITNGNQVLLVESKDSLLSESGELLPWVIGLIGKLNRAGYPRLVLLSTRRPTYIDSSIVKEIYSLQLRDLSTEKSILLFKWWLNHLNVSQIDFVVENLVDFIEGSQKQIELAARLIANLDLPNGLLSQRKRIFSDLEKQANVLLLEFADDLSCILVLAFIAECGYISETDLLTALCSSDGISDSQISDGISKLMSYGFVISDDISLRLPAFLVRSARNFSEDSRVLNSMRLAWKRFVLIFEDVDENVESSVAILTDMCLSRLKNGENNASLVDSILLPSQCFRVARNYYDQREYKKALHLCKKAYEKRIALTDEGTVEVLNIQGLSAARLNDQRELQNTLDSFSKHNSTKNAKRCRAFILGFEARLAGDFDSALENMKAAYSFHGEGDVHVLRELASLYWSQDDFLRAKEYIKKAKAKAKANPFILEMELKIELSMGSEYISKHAVEIENLIEDMNTIGRNTNRFFSKTSHVEYQLALRNHDEVRRLIGEQEQSGNPLKHSWKILKAKALLADARYSEARKILEALKSEADNGNGGQRHSSRPVIMRLLVESVLGISVAESIEMLRKSRNKMPSQLIKILKQEILETIAFTNQTVMPEDRKFLELS